VQSCVAGVELDGSAMKIVLLSGGLDGAKDVKFTVRV
jgi:hypothetical protein